MSNHNDEVKAVLEMTSATVGRDILSALVLEVKMLPSVWAKLSQAKQDDIIDRLRKRVDANVKMAVHLIASEGRTVVAGDLDQITIKDGVKAVVKFSSAAPNLHELYDASGKAVLMVVANPAQHSGGMDEVRGESDQRAMDLGREYTDGDGDGMEDAAADDNVVDVEVITIEHKPLTEELQKAWDAGYEAAEAGEAQSACPVMKGELCIEWVKGWKTWHEENNTEWWQAHSADDLGGDAA
ncbi:cell division protein FtsK [Ralstonia syzygii]|uniref:cell division protein FtsK n=1 Tax=Ralstonia syzygii TaxID=28097 RepID=UPI0027E16E4C|nr:cell division protein FtsK [Ralstonia syzygii]